MSGVVPFLLSIVVLAAGECGGGVVSAPDREPSSDESPRQAAPTGQRWVRETGSNGCGGEQLRWALSDEACSGFDDADYLGAFRAPLFRDGVLVGSTLYAGDATHVWVLDTGDPEVVTRRGLWDGAGTPLAAALHGTDVLLASGHAELVTIDGNAPSALARTSTLRLPGPALAVTTRGDRAFVAIGKAGVAEVDLAARPPRLIRTLPTGGFAVGVDVDAKHLFVAACSALEVLDLARGTLVSSRWITDEDVPSSWAHDARRSPAKGVVVSGTHAYVAAGRSGVVEVDVADPRAPAIAAIVTRPDEGYYASGVRVQDGVLYVAAGEWGVDGHRVDARGLPPRFDVPPRAVADADCNARPWRNGTVSLGLVPQPGQDPIQVLPAGDRIYAFGDATRVGLRAVDVRPADPARLREKFARYEEPRVVTGVVAARARVITLGPTPRAFRADDVALLLADAEPLPAGTRAARFLEDGRWAAGRAGDRDRGRHANRAPRRGERGPRSGGRARDRCVAAACHGRGPRVRRAPRDADRRGPRPRAEARAVGGSDVGRVSCDGRSAGRGRRQEERSAPRVRSGGARGHGVLALESASKRAAFGRGRARPRRDLRRQCRARMAPVVGRRATGAPPGAVRGRRGRGLARVPVVDRSRGVPHDPARDRNVVRRARARGVVVHRDRARRRGRWRSRVRRGRGRGRARAGRRRGIAHAARRHRAGGAEMNRHSLLALVVVAACGAPEPLPPGRSPPSIEVKARTFWPPLGPADELVVEFSDPDGVRSGEIAFVDEVALGGEGPRLTVVASGARLGEGFGTATVRGVDRTGEAALAWIGPMLVDFTPPEIGAVEQLVALGDTVHVRAGDAWALGAWSVVVGGRVVEARENLAPFGPPTLGFSWHEAVIEIPARALGIGVHALEVELVDAAGNRATRTIEVTVDGTAPVVSLEGAVDAAQPERASLRAHASDDRGAVRIDLEADGQLLATGLGPDASWVLDLGSFVTGAVALRAIATDEVGNRTASEPIVLEIARADD